MPKISSTAKPRLTIYLSQAELAQIKTEAKKAFVKTPHQLAGQWIRQKLSATK